jgi:drug/metabolite transporter (DMT)-like permease
MKIDKEAQGDLIILSEAAIWGLFPVITILAYATLSPIYTATLSIGFATLFFAIVLSIQKKWHELLNKNAWLDIFMAALLNGVIFSSLVFIGIKQTSAGNASIVALMEVFFTFVIFRLWKKEYLSKKKCIGALLMIIGALIILFPKKTNPNIGDLIILGATAIPPLGNYYTQRARKLVSSTSIMFGRSILSIIFLLTLAHFLEIPPNKEDIIKSLNFLIINGIIIFGFSKLLWIEGIHRISISKAISLASIAPAFTMLYAFLFLKDNLSYRQIFSFFPILIGIFLLTNLKISKTKK